MSEETGHENADQRPLYPQGVPNFDRLKFLPVGMIGGPQTSFVETVQAIGQSLNRAVQFVDDQGYERLIFAGAIDGDGHRLAWVESRSKALETGFVDVEFRLKAQVDGRLVIDWTVQTYNPYFGCRVNHMAWLGERIFVIYREKHHSYACILSLDGSIRREKITDYWLVAGDQIAYTSRQPDLVERLSLPDLTRLGDLNGDQAREAGLLPPWFEEINAHRRDWARRRASPTWQKRMRDKLKKILDRSTQKRE